MTELLFLSGSTRAASTNTAALRTAAAVAPAGVQPVLLDVLAELPAFNPDDDGDTVPVAVRTLRQAIAASDAVVVCTPEYAGTLPGSFKNLLDWTVGGGELSGKPVAWLNVAQPGRGEGAIGTLEAVLGYVDAKLMSDVCARIFVARQIIGADGLVSDKEVRTALTEWIGSVALAAIAPPALAERTSTGSGAERYDQAKTP